MIVLPFLSFSEYKSGAYPLLMDNWSEEYPMVLNMNAPVFYAWIGGSATNTFHEAVAQNEYYTDDSGTILFQNEMFKLC